MLKESTRDLAGYYRQHAPAVWAYARARAPHRDLAEDLASEAFLALGRRLATQGPPPDPLGYLLATVRSRTIDELRRGARRAPPVAAPPAGPEGEAAARRERVFEAVRALPAPLAEAVQLHLFAGLTFEESARAAGVPRGTLESRYASALEKLAVLLKDERP